MGLLDLLVAASMPVIQILLITALGLALALDRFAILGEDARKHLNNVSIYFMFRSLLVDSHFTRFLYVNLLVYSVLCTTTMPFKSGKLYCLYMVKILCIYSRC